MRPGARCSPETEDRRGLTAEDTEGAEPEGRAARLLSDGRDRVTGLGEPPLGLVDALSESQAAAVVRVNGITTAGGRFHHTVRDWSSWKPGGWNRRHSRRE